MTTYFENLRGTWVLAAGIGDAIFNYFKNIFLICLTILLIVINLKVINSRNFNNLDKSKWKNLSS